MKRLLLTAFSFFILLNFSFGKELSGSDLDAVNLALDAKLYVNDYEELPDQLAYLENVEKQISDLENSISEEARFLCNKLIDSQKQASVQAAELKLLKDKQNNKKPKKDKAAEAEAEAAANQLLEEYNSFENNHSDLSSHFYFHKKEAEMGALRFLPTGKQLKALMNIVEDYKNINEQMPDYGEILYTYGMFLYMMPKIAGGDKVLGLKKIYHATQVSSSNYEKAAALLLYSQILLEEKKKDESKQYLQEAFNLDPDNVTYKELWEMNEAGYSMFKMADYQKKKM